MHIVFCKEEHEFRVNYLDHAILLNPTDVPVQWLSVLASIDLDAIAEVRKHAAKFDILHSKFESMAEAVLVRGLGLASEHSGVPAQRITVRVRRGFTCSLTNYFYFLHVMNQQLNTFESVALEGGPAESQFPSNGGPDPTTRNETQQQQPQQMQIRPMEISIVVEDSHGTKLLQDGSFRVDARADTSTVHALLAQGSVSLVQLVRRYYDLQTETLRLSAHLIKTLHLLDIQRGVGVSDEQFVTCLQRMELYCEDSRTRNSLQQLDGFRVVVGHYLGMADDGACIIPWDIVLPDRIE